VGDTYQTFSELAENESEGGDWTRFYRDCGSHILVMAPHGGWIEPFTVELGEAIAALDLSFYSFQGLKPAGNHALHLTSHRFDEPLALSAASQADYVVAVHGERSGDEEFVMVGGGGDWLSLAIMKELIRSGFSAVNPRPGLGGRNPRNICNRGRLGGGVQLEISERLRGRLRDDPQDRDRFVAAVRKILLKTELDLSKEPAPRVSPGGELEPPGS